ncbi:hypothetical protein [Streptomyces sp. NPDC053755]|uniref:hypothetical protein n=1 Tax=Streptomyces sp. NPDC053755 TaxID=3155815 RepID=UPI003449E5E1
MAILIHAVLPGVTTEQYDAFSAKLQEVPGIFRGCLSHTCVSTDGGLEVFDLWESEADMDRFGERMTPIAQSMGFAQDAGRPKVLRVHRYMLPGAGTQ